MALQQFKVDPVLKNKETFYKHAESVWDIDFKKELLTFGKQVLSNGFFHSLTEFPIYLD